MHNNLKIGRKRDSRNLFFCQIAQAIGCKKLPNGFETDFLFYVLWIKHCFLLKKPITTSVVTSNFHFFSFDIAKSEIGIFWRTRERNNIAYVLHARYKQH